MAEMNEEIWLPVVGYEGRYEVSDRGRVRRIAPSRTHDVPFILQQANTSDGYLCVSLHLGGKRFHVRRVHGLVTRAFLGAPSDDKVVNHRDFDRRNNNAENLEWVTQEGNVHWSRDAGRIRQFHAAGESNPRAKLSAADVLEIRSLRGKESQSALAARFGVSKTAIRYAQTGRNWSTVREFPR